MKMANCGTIKQYLFNYECIDFQDWGFCLWGGGLGGNGCLSGVEMFLPIFSFLLLRITLLGNFFNIMLGTRYPGCDSPALLR